MVLLLWLPLPTCGTLDALVDAEAAAVSEAAVVAVDKVVATAAAPFACVPQNPVYQLSIVVQSAALHCAQMFVEGELLSEASNADWQKQFWYVALPVTGAAGGTQPDCALWRVVHWAVQAGRLLGMRAY